VFNSGPSNCRLHKFSDRLFLLVQKGHPSLLHFPSASPRFCSNHNSVDTQTITYLHTVTVLLYRAPLLGVDYDSSLVRPHSLKPLITVLYFVDFTRITFGR
jgi:hypothetical protein